MQYAQLGQSEISASRIAFGAWAIGGWMWGGQDERAAIAAIHAALDAGINFFDTAPMYGFGRSEEILGKALAGRRDGAVIATKCGLRWDSGDGEPHFYTTDEAIDPAGPIEVRRCNAPHSIRQEVEDSLRRLKIDCIDLLQTHWQETTTPIEETADAMLKLKEEGKIRAIGVSNASTAQITKYLAVGPVDTDQERYSMLHRAAEEQTLPFCIEQNIAFLAYSPLANGLLTGKITPDRTFPKGDLRGARPQFSAESRGRVMTMLEQLRPIAEAHQITFAQLALAWALARPGVGHVLVGARNPAQARENAAAADVMLTPEEIEAITRASAPLAADFAQAAARR